MTNLPPKFNLQGAELLHSSRSVGNADVYRASLDGRDVLVKSYRERPWLIRVLVGRRCLKTEWEIQNAIHAQGGLANVPKTIARPDSDTLVVQFILNEGSLVDPRKHPQYPQPPKEFFHELQEEFLRMHAAGIAHGDVRRANILIGKDGRPWIIDWATAVDKRKPCAFLSRMLFPTLCRIDLYALGKIISAVDEELLLPEVKEAYENPPFLLRIGQWYRQKIYKRLFRKRRDAK